MRVVRYPAPGKPAPTVSENLDELVMLTQAAISIANTRRRIHESLLAQAAVRTKAGRSLPVGLDLDARTHSYEVTVVDQFYQLGQQSFALHGSVGMWERPVSSAAGAHLRHRREQSIDMVLFNRDKGEEARLEFGFYKKSKLGKDAQKLINLSVSYQVGYPLQSRYLILWVENQRPESRGRPPKTPRPNPHGIGQLADLWRDRWVQDAAAVSTRLVDGSVALKVASSIDLFSEKAATPSKRLAHVGLFQVDLRPGSATAMESARQSALAAEPPADIRP